MNNTQKKIAAIGAVIVVVGVVVLQMNSWTRQVQERFPDVDKKIVKEAYRNMMKKAALQDYGNIEHATDAEMDRIFLQEVALIQHAK